MNTAAMEKAHVANIAIEGSRHRIDRLSLSLPIDAGSAERKSTLANALGA
jgi:hypothetical protein